MADDLPEIRSGKLGRYANYFHVGFNEYEFILDCGQSFPPEDPASIHTRIITSPVYATALWRTLGQSIQDYESRYGKIPDLETGN